MRGSHATTVVSMEVPPMGAKGPSAAGQHLWHWLVGFRGTRRKEGFGRSAPPSSSDVAACLADGRPAWRGQLVLRRLQATKPCCHARGYSVGDYKYDKFILSFQKDLDEPLGQLVSNLQDAHLETAACGFLSERARGLLLALLPEPVGHSTR